MNFTNMLPVGISFLSGFLLKWLHGVFTIRPNELKLRSSVPAVLRAPLQDVISSVVPTLAAASEKAAVSAIQSIAGHVETTIATKATTTN